MLLITMPSHATSGESTFADIIPHRKKLRASLDFNILIQGLAPLFRIEGDPRRSPYRAERFRFRLA